jgi:hypothetical protein
MIKSFVKAELDYFKKGGVGTELNGIYKVLESDEF